LRVRACMQGKGREHGTGGRRAGGGLRVL
jgi:hypothetical protein